jgi:short-subunit dehydrogenase
VAASGVGGGLARVLAARGDDLVVVTRSANRLEAIAGELAERHGARVESEAVKANATPSSTVPEPAISV